MGVNLISELAQSESREASHSPQTVRERSLSGEHLIEEERQISTGKDIPQATPLEKKQVKLIPIVFHWDHGGNGNDVYVCGSFNNWEKIPMNKR